MAEDTKLPRWRSRSFGEDTSARGVIAEALSKHAGHDFIPPGIWADAGVVVKALRDAGFSLRRPK